jgi:hypothetical protein
MALIKTGGGIAEIRGSIGGTVFSRGRYGAIARNRSIPVQPNSIRQVDQRSLFASVVAAWAALTANQRSAWNALGAALAMVNRLGETMYLSGQNHFIRANTIRISAGMTALDTAPAIAALDVLPASFAISQAVANEAGDDLGIAFTFTGGGADWKSEPLNRILCYRSTALNPTINYYNGPMILHMAKAGNVQTPLSSPLSFDVTGGLETFQAGQCLITGLRFCSESGLPSQISTFAPIAVDVV